MTLAILVYHRMGDGTAFHDVAETAFRLHLTLIEARGEGPDLLLTFDDGTAGHMRAAAMLEEIGWRGLFFVSPDRLDEPGRLTRRQVSELAGRGHLFGSHGLTHRRFDEMSADACFDELARSRAALEELTGAHVEWLATPGGIGRPDLAELARRAGYSRVRSMRWGYADSPDSMSLPVLPVTRRTRPATFARMIAGTQPIWPSLIKEAAKNALGEQLWTRFRERFL